MKNFFKIFLRSILSVVLLNGSLLVSSQDNQIASTGKIGIGTTTDLNRVLTVNGGIDIYGEGTSDVGLFLFHPVENGASSARWFLRADHTDNASFPYLTNRTPSGKVVIKSGTAAGGGENTHFTLEGGDGDVKGYFESIYLGIGTSNPADQLTIFEHSASTGSTLALDAALNKNPNMMFRVEGETKANIRVYDSGSDQLQFQVGPSLLEAMTITQSGFVGIGTANPVHELAVKGTIEAEEIIVQEVGADYVFGENYKLQPLEEVEKFIQEHQHLPGIAPASETEKGIGLAAFTEKLLEKIEELTLHQIALQKRVSELEQQLELNRDE